MDPTEYCLQTNSTTTAALRRQQRLNEWAREAALCLLAGDRRLAQFCLDELACIRRETEIDWSIMP